MGHREQLETALSDMQGHKIFLPKEIDFVETVMSRPHPAAWCVPRQNMRTRYFHKRMWIIASPAHVIVLLECLNGSIPREHTPMVRIVGQDDEAWTSLKAIFGYDPAAGYEGMVTSIKHSGATRRRFIVSNHPDVNAPVEFSGIDDGRIFPFGGGRVKVIGVGDAVLIRELEDYAVGVSYINKLLSVDLDALAAHWLEYRTPIMRGATLLGLHSRLVEPISNFLTNGPGWFRERGENQPNPTQAPFVESPLMGLPVKHNGLIAQVRKSLLSKELNRE